MNNSCLLAIGLVALFALPAGAVDNKVILDTQTDILGKKLTYPGGQPVEIKGHIITLAAGESTVWHHHPTPTIAYILAGSLSVTYRGGDVRTFTTGDTFVEAQNTPHFGKNTGDDTVKILIFYAGAEGIANTVVENGQY